VLAQALTATPVVDATPTPPISPPPVEHTLEILSVRPHDSNAFTQGLLLFEGRLFESTGRRGASTVREVDPATGAVLRQARLPVTDFGEGLARVGDRLIQITWQEGVAHVWDLETFAPRGLLSYTGEGWGLCYDGEQLVMTDGGDTLQFRDPESFALRGEVAVTLAGRRLEQINELECVGGRVWANVWFEDFIVAIDPDTGAVTDRVDATPLKQRLARDYPSVPTNVLNGIAYDPDTGHWLLTGKLWPALFEVRFVPGIESATPTPTVTATTTATSTPTATPTPRPLHLPRLEGRRR
jgi:glutaminyl-peptide cyclotransferase